MSVKSILFTIFVCLIVSLGIFLLIIFNIDPDKSDLLVTSTFFASIGMTITALFTLIIYFLRVRLSNNELVYSVLPVSIRQSALIALAVVGILAMQTIRLLNWWIGGIIVVVMIMVELFFRARTA